MVQRALIYARESFQEERSGNRSPDEQVAESRDVCAREGWDVAEVIVDAGIGASRHSKGTRDGWARAKSLIASGTVDVLVTWAASRAQRDLAAYAELRDLCATHGVLWSYKGRTHDLSTGDDRFRTGLDALLAEREADEISENVKRAMRANAAAGRPHGKRQFGFERVYDQTTGALLGQRPHPDEASVVRRIFDEFLSGASVRSIMQGLNRDGIRRTKTGPPWDHIAVLRLLKRPSYAGRRVYQGKVVGEAGWEPIVDPVTFDRAQALLADRERRKVRMTHGANLLTGVLRCSLCGGRMQVGSDGRNGRRMYRCLRWHLARDLRQLDRFVTAVIIRRLEQPDAVPVDTPDPRAVEAQAKVVALRSRLDEAVASYTSGEGISAAVLARIEADLARQITDAERAVRRARLPVDVDVPDRDVPGWWDSLAPERRRELVAALIEVITVSPTGRGKRVLDPNTIRITWWRPAASRDS